MPVPQPDRQNAGCRHSRYGQLVFLAVATVAALWHAPSAFAKPNKPAPEVRLPLEELGFSGVSSAFLSSGGSMLTVHFVDSSHLLVTFGLRGLVPRTPGDPPDDEDRMVAAHLIELPSGKVVARTEWHLHDHGRYLWNLGNGRFLLRIQNNFSTFAPGANLASGQAFERTSFPRRPGNIEAVVVSSDYKLLTVETSRSRPHTDQAAERKAAAEAAAAAARPHFTSNASEPAPPPPPPKPIIEQAVPSGPPVAIDFYRLSGSGALADPLEVTPAGAIGTTEVVALPVDGDGYLRPIDQSHGKWSLVFHPFSGKEIPLTPIETTCSPTVQRVSPTQFVSLNCHGVAGGLVLAAYDFDKHEMWEEPVGASPLPSVFAFAPAAGRFAVSRVSTMNSDAALATLPDNAATQDVRVYQTQTGDLLLKIDCKPVYRTAENFDLSADGMRVAVVRGGAIEIYHLPELTKVDHEDLVEMQKLAPPPASGRIDLAGLSKAAQSDVQSGTTTIDGTAPQTAANAAGDSQTPRKPPSILNPGEKPEFQDKNAPSN